MARYSKCIIEVIIPGRNAGDFFMSKFKLNRRRIMPRNYVHHPRTGYNDFLTFLLRYVYYDSHEQKGKCVTYIHQASFGKFLNRERSSISKYIKKAIQDGLIEKDGVGYFSRRQQYASNRYAVNINHIKEYLIAHNIAPLIDLEEANQEFINFLDLIKNGASGEDTSKDNNNNSNNIKRTIKAERLKKDVIHNHFNEIVNSNNKRLCELGLEKFTDAYLDEGKFRSYNIICHTKNPDNHINDIFFNDTSRNDLLKEFGIDNPIEYDVNGSIYRLTYNIMHQQQLSQEQDIYELFWSATGFDKEYTEELRKHLKAVCMTIYMKEQGILTNVFRYKSFKRRQQEIEFDCNNSRKRNYVLVKKNNIIKYNAYAYLIEYIGLELEVILKTIASAMHDVLGIDKFFGKDIFLYESEVYAEMKSKLLDRGIITLNCYDGFYFEKDSLSLEEFYTVYYEAVETMKQYIALRDEHNK